MRFINKEAQELAKQLHIEEHKIKNSKMGKDENPLNWYYLMASGIFKKIEEKIETLNVELFNKIVDLERRFYSMEKSIKEVSKQQKYLWQSLEQKRDVEAGVEE